MKRTTFVSSALSVAFLGGTGSSALAQVAGGTSTLPAFGSSVDPGNVLVVVQMGGGNDGLNTVVPWSDDAYHRVRPAIHVTETQVLKLNDRIGFNPALKGLNELYKEGRVAVVQGVGYPSPNRSHFEATQIWETASPDRPQQYGWLGRYLDKRFAGGAKPASMFEAVSLGDTLPAALVASHVEVPAIGALNAFAYNTGRDLASKQSAGVLYDGAKAGQSPYLAMIAQTARDAYHGGDVLRKQTAEFTNKATYASNGFAQQLALAAKLIGSSAGSKIVFVSIGSFDTHAGQRAQQDRLLGYLGDGLLSFYQDLAAHGLDKKVLTMTFSEFGRRVAQNASNGTDHGTAMPLFVVGGGVKGGIYGEHPSLTDLDRGDLKFSTDFRAVYATVIERWLGRNAGEVLGGAYPALAFV
ncbi:MAG: putative arylsulfatase family enzyme twin-arginine signal [Candidatus Eremiobacteraeota bacterium]|nr:putative arylsulfatase family enzyme twin-arginine signal [Candidatus Eremiobacteraeota bacterium]